MAGKQERRIFIWPDRARHPAVNPGRGDKSRDELVDATGSLVLIVRLLLVRVILHPFAFFTPGRSDPIPLLVHRCCLLRHSLVASSATRLFSLASPEPSSFLYLVCSLTANSLVCPGSDDIIDGGH